MRTAYTRHRTYSMLPGAAGFIAAVILAFLLLVPQARASTSDLELPRAQNEMTATDWASYGEVLVDAIKSGNELLVRAALRLSIQYAESVDVSAAIIDMMSVYREHDDDRVRQLAAVALASTESAIALGYLRLSVDFEKSPAVKRTIKALTSQDALTTV